MKARVAIAVLALAPAVWAQTGSGAPAPAPGAQPAPKAETAKPTQAAAPAQKPAAAPSPAQSPPGSPAAPAPQRAGEAQTNQAVEAAPPGTPAEPPAADTSSAAADQVQNPEPSGAAPSVQEPRVLPPSEQSLQPATPPAPAEPSQTSLVYDGPLGYHQDHYWLALGLRTDLVRDPRFDVFASNDALPQFDVQVGRTIFSEGQLSAAPLLAWDYGARKASLRGVDDAELGVHRLGAGLEARYHLLHRLYLFGRLRAGTARLKATLTGSPNYITKHWLFDGRAALGAAFELFGKPDGSERRPRGWLIADCGYALTSTADLDFEPKNPNGVPERAQPVSLGDVNLSGASLRFAAAISY